MSNVKKFEPIFVGDPGKLFYLVNSLYDRSAITLQKKINKYLQDISLCMLAFIVQEVRTVPKSIVRVIGEYELKHTVEVKPDCWFLQLVKEKNGAIVEEDDLDGLLKVELNHLLNNKYFVPFENCYILPIYHPISKKLCLYVGFVNYPREFEYEKNISRIADGCFRYCLPTLKSAFALEEEKLHRRMAEQMFKSVVSLVVDLENELLLYKGIKREAVKIFEAEECMVHITDENLAQKVIYTYRSIQRSKKKYSKMNINELSLPKNCTITDIVAKQGQIINCKHVSRDPYAHPDICKLKEGVWVLRNSLTFPIIMCNQIKGVIKLFNKITAEYFTELDEQNADGFGLVCGVVMQSARYYRRLEEKYMFRQILDCMLSRQSKIPECNLLHYKVPDSLPLVENLLTFKFNPYDMIGHDLVSYIMLIFYKLNILPKFKIEEDIFGRFVCGIFKAIPKLPFHNELHSFNAFHFIVLLTSYTNIQNYCKLTLTEILMLLIAALAQDMDWRGATTPFQFIRGTSLAALYTSPGMVEKRLVISQLIRLLTMHEYNIFKFMNNEHYKLCMELLYDMIIGVVK
ncbi:cGMP-dependent 3',5'-cyclic phosphodiesterase-like isoform X3 [Rhodnius prolixus]|uniref:cGMP-dependent 3',5'-cyclic phosphodiesterase-like isoform X3 n=1 Tax=Rhodnius prolixus TaxID=13249 RepID=UPI003D188CE3